MPRSHLAEVVLLPPLVSGFCFVPSIFIVHFFLCLRRSCCPQKLLPDLIFVASVLFPARRLCCYFGLDFGPWADFVAVAVPLAQSFASPEVHRATRCLSGSVLHLPRSGCVTALPPSVRSSCFAVACPARPGCYFSHVGCCSLRWRSRSADGSLCSIPQQHARLTLPLKSAVQLFVRF
jgi:hypothetical protein